MILWCINTPLMHKESTGGRDIGDNWNEGEKYKIELIWKSIKRNI